MKLVIEGHPPRKNDYEQVVIGKGGKPRRALTKAGRAFRNQVRNATRGALNAGQTFAEGPLFAVQIVMYVSTNRHFDDVTVPRRDIDSCITAVLDALEYAGHFGADEDADMRVEHLYPPQRFKDAANPRIEIEVTTWKKNPS